MKNESLCDYLIYGKWSLVSLVTLDIILLIMIFWIQW